MVGNSIADCGLRIADCGLRIGVAGAGVLNRVGIVSEAPRVELIGMMCFRPGRPTVSSHGREPLVGLTFVSFEP